jgi:2-amino-4-hydroxy-6-hydroxymethyldihydropteridine diphosphokinase
MGERQHHLDTAIHLIRERVGITLALSPIIETAPVGPADQLFLNGAVLCASHLAPESTMETLLGIEAHMGRIRREKWGNRLIDLDLLMGIDSKGEPLTCSSPRLQLPHPLMLTRTFVLEPAVAIAGDWLHPMTGKSLQEALRDLLAPHTLPCTRQDDSLPRFQRQTPAFTPD